MGRPTSLDDIVAKKIVDAVARGLPRDTAARIARVAPATLYNWLRRGREGDPAYVEFVERVRAAEAAGEDAIVGLLRGHAVGSWQACAWLLERRNPKRWAARKNVEAPVAGKLAELPASKHETRALLESLMAAVESAA